ncbi:Gfo/Idh/MocA family protein [Sunxiuqinia sp. sy24]|uniref:Gfo/Idh/MocA family protein n=1 Tax=Sunxiuqinia sp. sy24 TaxID=3461495 RepID=UPI0040459663
MKLKKSKTMSRRGFIGTSSVVLGGFTIIPSHAVSGLGHVAPSDKLNIAGIGIGGMGRVDLEDVAKTENIVALCDVDWNESVNNVFNIYPRAKRHKDFRIMLDEQKDIDAVIVATPDHNHAVISMEAMRQGKHVYTEKPLTHTVYEARMLTEAAQKYKVATQMGNQGQATDASRRMQEMIWDGVIGPIHEVHVWTDRPNRGLADTYWPQGVGRPADNPPVPESLDWDLFTGPAPLRPYHSSYHPFRWRGWLDFGTGALGDIGCHSFDTVFRALKLKYPTSIQAVSTLVNDETYPLGSIVTYDFPARLEMPPLRLTWYDGGLRPPRLLDMGNDVQLGASGVLYMGSKGKILGDRILPDSLQGSYQRPDPYLPSSPGHRMEWILACKGGDPAGSNYEWAGPLTETVLLGNISLRPELREKLSFQSLKFDSEKLTFPNMPEAEQFLHYKYREGWHL